MPSIRACTSSATATVLLSGWRLTLISTVCLPFAVTIVYTGFTPGATAATSPMRMGIPLAVARMHGFLTDQPTRMTEGTLSEAE